MVQKTQNSIIIKGASVHNLKKINVEIPRNKLVVITGVSGSGKSSLAIDTLYAEGQRRYVESLSAYARQFLLRMNKPEVEYITGIGPAIAIEQRVSGKTTRSTVGTSTEVFDYLRLFFARVGDTYSPKSGKIVKKQEVSDVVDHIQGLTNGSKVYLTITFQKRHHYSVKKELEILLNKGFSRLILDGETVSIEDVLESRTSDKKIEKSDILIDRFVIDAASQENQNRIADSVQIAFFEGEGECLVTAQGKKPKKFSIRFEQDGITFEEPSPQFFSFNSPYGACKSCEGFGSIIGIDEDLVIPNKQLSIVDGAIAPWRGQKLKRWNQQLIRVAADIDFPVHRPYAELTDDQRQLIWTGNSEFKGLDAFFKRLERKLYKIQNRVMIARYRGRTTCFECRGTRLRKEVRYVKVADKSLPDLLTMSLEEVLDYFKNLKLDKRRKQIAERVLQEITDRLQFLNEVGLGYLTLNRVSNTLSGGETQKINLTRALGSNLTSSLYILDEPSIGLHPVDTQRLIKVLYRLRDLGNTVIIVEHDEDIMRAADHIIDMGPLAGTNGGEVTYSGPFKALLNGVDTLTAKYLQGTERIEIPKHRRKWMNKIVIKGAHQHNLQNIDVTIPLNTLTAITGVSGSGKTTLVKYILYPALKKTLGDIGEKPGAHHEMQGDIQQLSDVQLIDQNPLGRSSRSNPVTYIKAYDAIRELFSKQQLSMMRGFKPKHFSFNVEGGRCETCKGEGEIVVEMQFLADIYLVCEACNGKRFKDEVLDVNYIPPIMKKKASRAKKADGKNIADVLELTVDEALDFFKEEKEVHTKLQPLADVGLGYVQLGQSSNTLSGGEAQRVKLASFLGKGSGSQPILFIFDEPTTGLHFHDIKKLLGAFQALIEKGHSIVVIEHNQEVIKSADWVLDLGPKAGKEGGKLVFAGTPEDLVKEKGSLTGQCLLPKLS